MRCWAGPRGICERGAFGIGLLYARLQRLDLRNRAFVTLAPARAIGADCRKPPRRDFCFARECLGLCARLGKFAALRLYGCTGARKPRFNLRRGRKRRE